MEKYHLAFVDRLPASVRHALLLLLATLVTWGAAEVPNLDLGFPWSLLVGPVVTYALAWATPITRQYGVGSSTSTFVALASDEAAHKGA